MEFKVNNTKLQYPAKSIMTVKIHNSNSCKPDHICTYVCTYVQTAVPFYLFSYLLSPANIFLN